MYIRLLLAGGGKGGMRDAKNITDAIAFIEERSSPKIVPKRLQLVRFVLRNFSSNKETLYLFIELCKMQLMF